MHPLFSCSIPFLCILTVAFMSPIQTPASPRAQSPHPVIEPARGLDSRVDYPSLIRFGPWDDRNYSLTAEDLTLLSPDEHTLTEPIPAFFRIELRQQLDLPRRGSWQYPFNAPELFLMRHGGFEVDGVMHQRLRRVEGRPRVLLDPPPRTFKKRASKRNARALDGDVRVSEPGSAAESAVAVHPTDPSRVITAYMSIEAFDPLTVEQLVGSSTDGGKTWQLTSLPGDANGDPTVAWSANGEKAYVAALGGCLETGGCDLFFYRSADGGLTWNDLETQTPGDPQREFGQPADKGFMHVDIHPDSPYKDRLYLIWWAFSGLRVAHSADLGNTWTTITIPGATGVGADLASDADGNLYAVWPDPIEQKIFFARSTDGGMSFGPPSQLATTFGALRFPLPSQAIRGVPIIVSADIDTSQGPNRGSLYVTWADALAPPTGNPDTNHARVVVAFSRDSGQSWQEVTPHATDDSQTVDRWQPWIAVDPQGHIHIAFFDTRNAMDRAGVDLYQASSTDGGLTWTEPKQLSSATSTRIESTFEFGDYNNLAVTLGSAVATFTDNRDEEGTTIDSEDIYAAGFNPPTAVLFADGFESGDTSRWSGGFRCTHRP